MDVVYLILIGVGFVCIFISFFLKGKQTNESDSFELTRRTADKAEVDKKWQLLGKQIKQDKDYLLSQIEIVQGELLGEIHALRKRIEQLESQEVSAKAPQAPTIDVLDSPIMNNETQQMNDVDMLALRERYRRVFELHREGLSLDEISKRMGTGRGEIDLIFALAARKERGTADA